jgi:hypothetical protein
MDLVELPSRKKFIAFYYAQIGWTTIDEFLLKVTDLTLLDISAIKKNWVLLYKKYIEAFRYTEERVFTLDVLIDYLGKIQHNDFNLFHWELIECRDEMDISFNYELAKEFYTDKFEELYFTKIKEAKLKYLHTLLCAVETNTKEQVQMMDDMY